MGSALLGGRGSLRCVVRQRLAVLVDPQALGQANDIKAASDFADARLGAARNKFTENAVIIVGAIGAIEMDSSFVFEFEEFLQLGRTQAARALRTDSSNLGLVRPHSATKVIQKASDGVAVGVACVAPLAHLALALVEDLGRADKRRAQTFAAVGRRHVGVVVLGALSKVDEHDALNALPVLVQHKAQVMGRKVAVRDRGEVAGVLARNDCAAKQGRDHGAYCAEDIGGADLAVRIAHDFAQLDNIDALDIFHSKGGVAHLAAGRLFNAPAQGIGDGRVPLGSVHAAKRLVLLAQFVPVGFIGFIGFERLVMGGGTAMAHDLDGKLGAVGGRARGADGVRPRSGVDKPKIGARARGLTARPHRNARLGGGQLGERIDLDHSIERFRAKDVFHVRPLAWCPAPIEVRSGHLSIAGAQKRTHHNTLQSLLFS